MEDSIQDQIWALAREDAKEKYLNNLVGGCVDSNLVPTNPYKKNSERYEEYECAFEHYAMSLLGY